MVDPVVSLQTPGRLKCYGICFGTLTSCRTREVAEVRTVWIPTNLDDFATTLQAWCKLIDGLDSYPNGETPLAAFRQTVTFHASRASVNSPDFPDSFARLYDLMHYPDCQLFDAEKVKTVAELFRALNSDEPGNRSGENHNTVVDFLDCVSRFDIGGDEPLQKMRILRDQLNIQAEYALFVLDSGYMGMGFHTCREGDVVFLLAGAEFPMVLRPDGAQYRSVAPTYVHGVMEGELWQGEGHKLEEVVLI